MEIIFESHSTSIDNERGIASGYFDPPLSSRGLLQAKELGGRYAGSDISVIYCSDLMRSRDTARIAFEGRAVEIVEDGRLREWDYGRLNGSSALEVENLKRDCIYQPFPGGESLLMALERVYDFFDEGRGQFNVRSPMLVIGHRVVFYALEYRYRRCSLEELVTKKWSWQPGWRYRDYVSEFIDMQIE